MHGIVAFFVAYIVGSIVGIFLLSRKKRSDHMIAFGPFIGIGWLLALLFHDAILAYFL
jgi:leader peptidase (prepilin peptidase) / N-methyltransferase